MDDSVPGHYNHYRVHLEEPGHYSDPGHYRVF